MTPRLAKMGWKINAGNQFCSGIACSLVILRANDQNTLHICASTFLAERTYPKARGRDSAGILLTGLVVVR
jgi:hypothetical protein